MTILRHTAVGLTLLALACGGGKSEASGPTEPGESGGGDLETPTGGGGEPGADAGATEPTGPAAPVTFVLKNSHTDELAFNMDRGWGINIFAYTGKPPKA